MELIKPGLTKHECDTPRLDPNWMTIKGPKYKDGSLVKCECGAYYLIKARGVDGEWLTWNRIRGIRLRRMLRSVGA